MDIEYNMRGILHAFFRQKLKFVLFFVLFSLMGVYYVSKIVPVYSARGSLLVKFGQAGLPDVNLPGNRKSSDFSSNDRSELLESNVQILLSQNLLSDVVSAFGLERLYPGMLEEGGDEGVAVQNAVRVLLSGALDVRVSGGSNIIELFVFHEDPEVAAQFANQLMDMFIVRQAKLYNTAQTSFLEKQVQDMKRQLEVSRQRFLEFKKGVGISAIDEEMKLLLAQKGDLSAIAFQSVSSAQATLSALEAKAAEMSMTYQQDSPVMQRLRDSIVVAQEQLEARQLDLSAAGDVDGALSSKIATIDERIAWLEEQRGRYNELSQRVKMDEDNYTYYQQRGEEARVNMLLNAENITRVSVIDQAVVPTRPVGPRWKVILLAFLMAGILFGLGVALAFELLDDRLTTPEGVSAAAGVPVLAAFGKV